MKESVEINFSALFNFDTKMNEPLIYIANTEVINCHSGTLFNCLHKLHKLKFCKQLVIVCESPSLRVQSFFDCLDTSTS